MSLRIKEVFSNSSKKLVTFTTGGDPNISLSKKIINSIAESGADIIEIGMPFSDPMADGPTIQLSSNRAIKEGIKMDDIFDICKDFRNNNQKTPIILMGYYNPILNYGVKNFINSCESNGIDGLIIVDLQPEEDQELLKTIKSKDIDLIRLVTPTTDSERLKAILNNSSGFLYYVTITGITGQQSANLENLQKSIEDIKKVTELPVVSGFGIKDKRQVSEVCKICDGAVVGSSIIKIIEENLNDSKKILFNISKFVKDLKEDIR